jgi:hypothetical protein
MSAEDALKVALSLIAVPTQIKSARLGELPHGVNLLLNVAVGDQEARRMWSRRLERDETELVKAAEFFIEQVMLFPGSDSYRVLGSAPTATTAELRANMALLMRWLHPDVRTSEKRSTLANRVLAAWENIKTPDKRRAYDLTLKKPATSVSKRKKPRRLASQSPKRRGFIKRLLSAVLRRPV